VREAKSGQEALEQVILDPPDLLVVDVLMPEMDGFTLCQKIRAMPEPLNRLPIILLTALDTTLGRQVGQEVGADFYLTKPFSPRQLRQKVRQVLAALKAQE
jgi:CheY-like chemotaxis protein